MKLIVCRKCQQFISLNSSEWIVCKCGASFGKYLDYRNAVFGGYAIPIGIDNGTFLRALLKRGEASSDSGVKFEAFVISDTNCKTFKKVRRPKELQKPKQKEIQCDVNRLKSLLPFKIIGICHQSIIGVELTIDISGLEEEYKIWMEFCKDITGFFDDNGERWKHLVNHEAKLYGSPFAIEIKFTLNNKTYTGYSIFPRSIKTDGTIPIAIITGQFNWFPDTGEKDMNVVLGKNLRNTNTKDCPCCGHPHCGYHNKAFAQEPKI